MKFYMAPGSCSTGIHILLEELDLIFEAYVVSIPNEEHLSDSFVSINPKSTIPVLVTDNDQVITEFPAIAYWLARTYPKRKLLPEDVDSATRTLELISYIVDTVHGKGFSRLFVTEDYLLSPDQDGTEVQFKGRLIIDKAFATIDAQLEGKEYFNNEFSIADAALFYVEFWAHSMKIDLPENCERHYQKMLKRPTVRNVLMEEGYYSYVN